MHHTDARFGLLNHLFPFLKTEETHERLLTPTKFIQSNMLTLFFSLD